MAVETKTPKFTRAGIRPKPAGNFELLSWYFFRISGILLLFLAIGHLIIMHISFDFQHLSDVHFTNYDFVAERWQNPLWRLYDLALLLLALLHGMNGVRVMIDDYTRTKGARLLGQSILAVVTLFFLLMGTITIMTFQPMHSVLVH